LKKEDKETAVMVSSTIVARELPRLRRYARTLTGSQVSGDAYVNATLEAVVGDPTELRDVDAVALDLFRVFSRIWNSIDLNKTSDQSPSASDRHLSRVTPLPRQAFLLLGLEDFSEDDAAEILGIGKDEVQSLIDDSGRELAAEIATDVLIIEDEPLIGIDLEVLVEGLGHSVTGIARTHKDAIQLARAREPGLVLADIRLADGSSGLDAVNEMLASFEVPVVFITAFPEQLLTGTRPEPAFLIAKPFRPATVAAIISQALFFERRAKLRPAPVQA
jgi:DNA-directed RNA polymerase specialized sigma24 family protein/CheY-like chemotaxis protein